MDKSAILIALIVAIPPTLAGVAAVIVALRAKAKTEEIHLLVNSKMTELLELTAKASRAEGVKSETDKP